MTAEPESEVEATPTPEPTTPREPTLYVILRKTSSDENDGSWEDVGSAKGSSSTAALRAFLGADITEGTYVAIPDRSWQPKTVGVETQTKLILE